VNAGISPPRRIKTETIPRKTEASMVQDDDSVLTILKSRLYKASGMKKPHRKSMTAI
jgi:hypothetical protein